MMSVVMLADSVVKGGGGREGWLFREENFFEVAVD